MAKVRRFEMKNQDTVKICPVCGYEFPIENAVREETVIENGVWKAVEYLPDSGRYIHHQHKFPDERETAKVKR